MRNILPFPLLREPAELDAETLSFLDGTTPVVSLSLGAMAAMLPFAGRRLGRLSLILASEGIKSIIIHPERISAHPMALARRSLPHEALFPRCALAMHHGGIGTTMAASDAGVPQLITAVGVDQFGWGRRIQNLSCGRTLAWKGSSPRDIARAIVGILKDDSIKAACTGLASSILGQDRPAAYRGAVEALITAG